jgi:serine/threonine protein phosphatase PrpC
VYARLLRRAVRVADRRLRDAGKRDSKLRGMGTTVSAAVLVGDTLMLAQVGDSRAYVLRDQTLVQVTRDQSVAEALFRSGRMTAEEARALPQSNMVLQALGGRQTIEVALSMVELRRGDRLLLCSDGLHGPIDDALLTSFLSVGADLRATAELLIEAAYSAGAPDNITVVLAGFAGDGLPPPDGELPRFIELDPMEEGARALATTSVIGKRLAARVGLATDPGQPVVPATLQHTAIRLAKPDPLDPEPGPNSGTKAGAKADAGSPALRSGWLRPGWPLWLAALAAVAAVALAALLFSL